MKGTQVRNQFSVNFNMYKILDGFEQTKNENKLYKYSND